MASVARATGARGPTRARSRGPRARVMRGAQPSSLARAAMSAKVASTSPRGTGAVSTRTLTAGGGGDRVDERPEVDRRARAEVVRAEPGRRRGVERREHAADDVVDVREVAAHRPVAEDRDRLAGERRAHEARDRHLRTLPRPVHREEAERGAAHRRRVPADARRDQLGGALARGVGRLRDDRRRVLAGGQGRGVAVDRRARGEEEALDAALARELLDDRRALRR